MNRVAMGHMSDEDGSTAKKSGSHKKNYGNSLELKSTVIRPLKINPPTL
jgi:hypothetical protein